MNITILGIESSCDDTSAAVIRDGYLLSNIIANQSVHKAYGGVVPELASRAHQQNIIPVVDQALKMAGVSKKEISAVAFTRGPGLLGSLLVGTSFAKSFALAMEIPLVEVNHLQAHILVHFIKELEKDNKMPEFPFLCLLVSGGHTQLVVVKNHLEMEIIGQTIDDAAGEAFDKCAKVIGLPYPGGPVIDKNAQQGDPLKFQFSKPRIKDLDYSFSGLKTSFLYFIRDMVKEDPLFVQNNMMDLCASLQYTIIEILMNKLVKASKELGIKHIAVAGGVSANSGLRNTVMERANKYGWQTYIPEFKFTTDNAAMVAITGYYKYLNKEFASQDVAPLARFAY
ncbi:MAG TPA: tRNA (adenosine(37)-N6)-threonylcarbamoyltransferase complex transferase subunit TsaD [Bacteroidales bacterium]|nr:tRNA (adenosine(37)-N6)-threonylcarbamoyltransferase complex transferase subunit TsaD [Bacteroidales bacterium]